MSQEFRAPSRRWLRASIAAGLIAAAALPAGAVLPRRATPKGQPAPQNQPASQSEPVAAPHTGDAKPEVPQVEVYVPSVAELRSTSARSKTAALLQAVAPLLKPAENETGDGIDFAALLAVVDQVRAWPDTSLALAVFTQDSEGRPRWTLQVDWPIDDLARRVREILSADAARKLLENVKLTPRGNGAFALELADTALAVFEPQSTGTRIVSAPGVRPPEKLWGRGAKRDADDPPVLYCRLNLAEAPQGESSLFGAISGIRDLRYSARLDQGVWDERFSLGWNPLLGMAIKTAVKRVRKTYDCPTAALANAALNLDMGGALADELADLPPGTIGRLASGEFAVSLLPPSGFLPFPDLFYQLSITDRDKVIKQIRAKTQEQTAKRAEDDDPPMWYELSVDDQPVFWRDPTSGETAGFGPVTYRTVIFFDAPPAADDADSKGKSKAARMIIAGWTGSPEDTPAAWKRATARRSATQALPAGGAHWQMRINWRQVYAQVEPLLSVLASLSDPPEILPTADSLGDTLDDSVIDVRIEAAGLKIVHRGPVPLGAGYVPFVTAMSLASRDDPSSEAERQRIACRNLRALYHHAKLFKKDYGRWPATVAELDGYVDFASHPDLLWLPPPKRGFIAGLAGMVVGADRRPMYLPDDHIDDSLYEIEWSVDAWRLKLRTGEFADYETIAIDQEGRIVRVPRPKKVPLAEAAPGR
ncbi:MAG: hypothetical protein U1A27_08030 [Phycisphaerae bacterium]